LIGVALGAIATAIRMPAIWPFGRDLPFLTFFPALVIASTWGRITGGVSCLAASTLAAAFLLSAAGASSIGTMGAFWVAGGLVILVAAGLSRTVQELRQSHSDLARARIQLQTLVGELAHRNRNALFVIMAIVRQSAQGARSAHDAEQIINGRLEAMIRAQEVIVQSGEGADLRALVEKSLAPFALERFSIAQAPDVFVEREVATGLGLLFHELATNAVKYGALSTPVGRVQINWSLDETFAQLGWRERGGPASGEPPSRKGFGARLIEVALVPQGGGVERRFEPDGVACDIRIPLAMAEGARGPPVEQGAAFVDRLSAPN
jgi:two-component sensor histidine kinase